MCWPQLNLRNERPRLRSMPMTRLVVFSATVLLPIFTGCSKKDSAPVEAPAVSEPSSNAPPPQQPVAVAARQPEVSTAPPVSAAPASAPPAAAINSPYRDVTARFLESDDRGGWRKNEKAATDLEKLKPDEVAQLWPLLKDPQAEVRRGAATFLLETFDPDNRAQVASYTALLADQDRMVRARALDAVKQFSDADKRAAIPRVGGMLDSQREDRPENRASAARLLGSLKQEAAPAVPPLTAAASGDPDAKVRAAALAAITQVAASPDTAVGPLAKGLADSDASVRLVAAARLRQFGMAATPAAKQLATALADSSNDVAEAAAEALLRIGPAAIEPLTAELSSKNASARKLALACLVRIGRVPKVAAPQIEKLKQDADPQVRQLAETALKNLAGQ
jgi:HEAT repeat protein